MTTGTLTLKTAIGGYPHFQALKDGSIKPDGVDFEMVEVAPITTAFRNMCRNLEYDISEMAITTYLTAKRYGLPFTAIPVFPVRAFHHNPTMVNINAGIENPKDLEGKKAGVRAYTVTTGVWARGILNAEYGVDLDKIEWVLADEEHVDAFHKDAPKNANYQLGADLGKMLTEGELAAGIGISRGEQPELKALIPDARGAAASWYQRTGIYPINHMVVVKNELLEANPDLAVRLFKAFKAAKDQWLASASDDDKSKAGSGIVKGDPFPYGVAENSPALEAIIKYAADQHILTSPFAVEEIFAKGTQDLE